jgi:glycerate dehydrogenase
MRIVYLDEPTYLPDDWRARFATLGEFEVFEDRPDPDTAVSRLCQSDLAIVEWTPLTAEILRQLTRLRYLTLVTTSHDTVDVTAAAEAGITVANCPRYSVNAVAEHVFASLLALIRRLVSADAAARQGASHLYRPFLGRELRGQTLGLIGTGRIATAVADIAAGFGMHVVACNHRGAPAPGHTVKPLDEVLHDSDILSIHAPLNDSTRGLLDAGRLALLRPNAIVVNTSRAQIVDQAALTQMLASGRLAGAALDDLSHDAVLELRRLPNVLLTPGTAWYTETARTANLVEIYDNLTSYLAGRPRNIISRPR